MSAKPCFMGYVWELALPKSSLDENKEACSQHGVRQRWQRFAASDSVAELPRCWWGGAHLVNSMRSRSRSMRAKRLRRTSFVLAPSATSNGKKGRSGRLVRQSRAAEVAARFLVASEERTSLTKSLARTVADTHMVEQRLKDMQLLHQRIEEHNQQLRLVLALHRSIMDAQQRPHDGGCDPGEDPSP